MQRLEGVDPHIAVQPLVDGGREDADVGADVKHGRPRRELDAMGEVASSVMVSRGTSENTVMNSEKAVIHERLAKRNRH
ncbi:hypothetical protein [Amycolatopsis saalfeldensis]|uniref:hypothetical protein n=1 Tax=Amycolatopsis saalfeldensis TaxID=394193 RepID=UPI001FE43800|nr:hypothetical protein [Amycolatopsis saalfeldensis]